MDGARRACPAVSPAAGDGTSFAVWAPNAQGVRVTADFNFWDGRAHPMRSMGSSGVWELFVPGVGPGTRYKFEICGRDGVWRQKADPMAAGRGAAGERVGGVRVDVRVAGRRLAGPRGREGTHAEPMSVYEVHLGSWRAGESYRDLADELVDYVTEMGFTHVELMPAMEHPFGGSWGYQVTSYFAPTSRFGDPDDFRFLVDSLHQANIGVLVDWVPAHFPKDAWALARFDGTPLYEHPDPRRGEQPDWGTLVFDFGRPQVRNFLVANAVYWAEEFHIDGLRVDAVASMLYLDYSREEGEWVPNQYGGRENLEAVSFLQEMNATVYKRVPGVITVAEESTSWPGVTRATHLGGLGFGFKWNMGWMNDSLRYLEHEPIHRQFHHHELTFSMMYAYSENFVLPLCHDEVVHGKGSLLRKMPGDRWQQLANLRAYLAMMWAHPGKQLLFMGCEFGQESEWSEKGELDWWLLDHSDHGGLQQMVKDLNGCTGTPRRCGAPTTSPSGSPGSTRTTPATTCSRSSGTATRASRRSPASPTSPRSRTTATGSVCRTPGTGTRCSTPTPQAYSGSGVGNFGGFDADGEGWHGMASSAEISVPPLGTIWFRYDG